MIKEFEYLRDFKTGKSLRLEYNSEFHTPEKSKVIRQKASASAQNLMNVLSQHNYQHQDCSGQLREVSSHEEIRQLAAQSAQNLIYALSKYRN